MKSNNIILKRPKEYIVYWMWFIISIIIPFFYWLHDVEFESVHIMIITIFSINGLIWLLITAKILIFQPLMFSKYGIYTRKYEINENPILSKKVKINVNCSSLFNCNFSIYWDGILIDIPLLGKHFIKIEEIESILTTKCIKHNSCEIRNNICVFDDEVMNKLLELINERIEYIRKAAEQAAGAVK